MPIKSIVFSLQPNGIKQSKVGIDICCKTFIVIQMAINDWFIFND